MKAKWAMVFAIAGFIGAAIFYSPYLNGQTHLVCPLCPHVTMAGGTLFSRFTRLTIGGGLLNALSFMLVGLAIARKLKKTENRTMATPEHKLTGKSPDEPAEQSAAPAAEQSTSLDAVDQSASPGASAEAHSDQSDKEQPTSRGAAEQMESPADSAQPDGPAASAERSTNAAESAQALGGTATPASASAAAQPSPGTAVNPSASATSADSTGSVAETGKATGADLPATGNAAERSASSTESHGNGGAYKIHIPMYEGPLDLLLDLIKTQRMSIHDIRISEITAQYLDYLHKLEELDVDVSAEFIYMAATLIYIKSKMLLPPDPLASPEEQTADPRAELVQRLVEHEKFKSAAQILYQKQQIEENVWSKPDKTLYQDPGTEGELVVSLVDLVKVFQQVLERRKETVRIELHHEQFTVAQMIVQLRAQIIASVENAVNLIQFFEACPSRHAMIVAFLAVLEMVKLQAVALVQEKMFGDILVKKGKSFDVVFDENGAIRMVDEEYR